MEMKVQVSLLSLILMITNDFGGVMIVQGRSRGGGGSSSSHSSSSHSSSSHSSSSHSSSSHSSNSGHVYTRPILTRNYGGYSGRQSTSNSGFGLGLGSGLAIGYGINMLKRPIGYGTPGYGYDMYHRARIPRKSNEPLECVVASYTLYAKSGAINDEMDMDEDTKTCAPGQNVCFGRLTLTAVNLTTISGVNIVAIQMQVEKDCDTITITDDYLKMVNSSKGVYDKNRRCFHTTIKEVSSKNSTDNSLNEIYEYEDNDHILTSSFSIDNFEDREILDALEIVGDIKRIYKIKQQTETCICDSMLCNSSMKFGANLSKFLPISMFLITSKLKNIF